MRRLPREKLVVLDNTPPYCRWWLLAKLTPNMTARLMGRRCQGFDAERRVEQLVNRGFNYMRSVVDVEDMVFGDRFDDRVQKVAWPNSVVRLEFGVVFEQEIDGV